MGADLTLVFTMSRVGSSAAYRALADGPGQVFHIHTLNPAALQRWRGRIDEAPRHLQESFHTLDALRAHEGRVRLVSLVRDVVDRNLSAAHARWRRLHGGGDWREALERGTAAECWAGFNVRGPMRWFDQNLKQSLGVDVYRHPFPDTGYVAFGEDRYDVLVMRADLPNRLKSELLTEFSEHPADVGLVRAVRREGNEEVRAAYQAFCARVPLAEEWLRSVAESRYMEHFFAPDPDTYVREWLHHHRLTEQAIPRATPS